MQRPANPDQEFRRLVAAEAVSNFGAMLSRLAIPWLAALVLDATPLEMAALLVADVAAGALGALLLGAWVERQGKRAVMLLCDGARAVVLAALALLAWRGAATMAWLALAAAANGVLTLAFEVARSAWMAQRLETGALVQSNARMSVATSLSETAAFALGGWLFQWLGAVLALVVDAVSYAASALCLRGVREVPAPLPLPAAPGAAVRGGAPQPAWRAAICRDAWREMTAGLVAVAAHATLRALAVIEGLLAFAMSLAGTSYMIYVARDLALPTGQLGLVFALGGAGAIIGARLAPPLGARLGAGRAMTSGLIAVAAGAACIPLAAEAGLAAIGLLVAHQVVGDGGHTLFSVHDRTLRQTEVDASLLARADAGMRGIGQAATLAGAGIGGVIGTAFDARGTLVLSAATLFVAAGYAAWRLRPRASRHGTQADGPSPPPAG